MFLQCSLNYFKYLSVIGLNIRFLKCSSFILKLQYTDLILDFIHERSI